MTKVSRRSTKKSTYEFKQITQPIVWDDVAVVLDLLLADIRAAGDAATAARLRADRLEVLVSKTLRRVLAIKH